VDVLDGLKGGSMESWMIIWMDIMSILQSAKEIWRCEQLKEISTGWNLYFMARYLNTDKIKADAQVGLINIQGIVIINIAYLQL